MAKTKGDFYFIGFGNMAQAIYEKMNKSAYKNIFLIDYKTNRMFIFIIIHFNFLVMYNV